MEESCVRLENLVISANIEGYDFYERQGGESSVNLTIKAKFLEDDNRQLKRLRTDTSTCYTWGPPTGQSAYPEIQQTGMFTEKTLSGT